MPPPASVVVPRAVVNAVAHRISVPPELPITVPGLANCAEDTSLIATPGPVSPVITYPFSNIALEFRRIRTPSARLRGAKNYTVDGHMNGGFALLAFPAKWGDSGIMTLVVTHRGIVFQKNLGPDTARLAGEIKDFDPDLSRSTH